MSDTEREAFEAWAKHSGITKAHKLAMWNTWSERARRSTTTEARAPLSDEHEFLVESLRSFARAYPEDIFGPVTDEERKAHGNLISRASGSMGRHVGKWMTQAADAIERLAARAPAPPLDVRALTMALEKIAQQWDGCLFEDAPGGAVEVGEALRASFAAALAGPPLPSVPPNLYVPGEQYCDGLGLCIKNTVRAGPPAPSVPSVSVDELVISRNGVRTEPFRGLAPLLREQMRSNDETEAKASAVQRPAEGDEA